MPPKKPVPASKGGNSNASVKQETTLSDQAAARDSHPDDAATSSMAAPNSAPPPPKRLESITRPSSSSSSAAGSSRGGRPSVAPKPKFAGRRSQAARQEAEQVEAAKKAAEAQAKAAEAKKFARDAKRFGYGRGGADRGARGARGGRGRGGHMGDRKKDEPVASGPFSSGQVTSDGRRSGWTSGGGSGAFGAGWAGSAGAGPRAGGGSGGRFPSTGGAAVKLESGDVTMGGMDGRAIKAEDGGYISSDEDEGEQGPKQNIDRLQVIDLTGESTSGLEDQFAPVRLTRVPHKDRTVGLNIEDDQPAESSDNAENAVSEKRKKGKQKTKDIEVTGATERPKRPTVYSSSDTDHETHIKEEPMEDENRTSPSTIERLPDRGQTEPSANQDVPLSPENKRRVKEKIKATTDRTFDSDSDDFPIPDEPRFQTQAEKDEWERKYMDLRSIRDELGLLTPKPTVKPTPIDGEGETTTTEAPPVSEAIKQQQAEREQNVYVFQFPPVLPGLAPVSVKSDPENIHVAHPDEVKDVGQVAGEPKASHQQQDQRGLPSGAVGKLKIHKSGKATLDWGGTSLVLGMGAEATFLQNVLLARLPQTKPKVKEDGATGSASDGAENQDSTAAVGMGMGQIRGKFVLTPDWDEILK